MGAMQIEGDVDGRYARIAGELIPYASSHWLEGDLYRNPFQPPLHRATDPKEREFIVVILRRLRVVITEDAPHIDDHGTVVSLTRTGVRALHHIVDPAFSPAQGLTFRLGRHISDVTPKNVRPASFDAAGPGNRRNDG